MRGLQRRVLADQRVIFRVRKLRRVVVVIERIVPRDLGGEERQAFGGIAHAASSSRSACARASSVTVAPDSIRAISSRRSASSRARTPVRVTTPSWRLAMSKCAAPRAATCGLWVTTSNCVAVGEAGEAFADRARHRAADAAVDLVEDHRRGRAFLGQRDLQREDEAAEFAARRDLDQRPERRAGVGGDLELHPVAAGGGPVFGRQVAERGAEARRVELQRRKLARDGGVEAQRGGGAGLRQRSGGGFIGGPGARHLGFERGQPAFAGVERLQLAAQVVGEFGEVVGLDAVLARDAAQFEQAFLVLLLRLRIDDVAAGGFLQPVLRHRAFDDRAVDGGERFGQVLVVGGDAFEDARGLAKLRQAAGRALQEIADRVQVVGDLFGALHRAAAVGERFLLARFRGERVEFGDGMFQPVAVARGGPRSRRGRAASAPSASRHALNAAAVAAVSAAPKASSSARWPRGLSRPRSSCWPWISTSRPPSSRSSAADAG